MFCDSAYLARLRELRNRLKNWKMSERGAGLLAIDARTKIDVSIKRRQQGRQQEKGQTDCRTRGRRKIK